MKKMAAQVPSGREITATGAQRSRPSRSLKNTQLKPKPAGALYQGPNQQDAPDRRARLPPGEKLRQASKHFSGFAGQRPQKREKTRRLANGNNARAQPALSVKSERGTIPRQASGRKCETAEGFPTTFGATYYLAEKSR